jgi:hypothetical protein
MMKLRAPAYPASWRGRTCRNFALAAFALTTLLAVCVNTAEIRELEQDCVKKMAEGSKKPATLEKAEKLCADRFADQKKEAFEKDSGEFAAGVGTVLIETARTLVRILVAF